MSATLKINGHLREFTESFPATIAELLKRLEIDQATVVAEIDGKIVPRAEFDTAALHAGAAVELVRFVGGG